MQALSLYELNSCVRSLIEEGMDTAYWVHGELLEGREAHGGHFYGELVEKDEKSNSIIARARITIWARIYYMLAMRFREETGQSLRPGIKVLVRVKVTFNELYGYSLNVLDIDGTYTLGDMARRRQEILHRLEEDGIIDDNKTLPLPTLIKRVAVVSSASAAGYGDFSQQLLENDWGLAFRVRLFPAIMQGQHVPESIASALSEIADEADNWDVVVIIRGGGATSDLSDYDSYLLASCIAQHPLPIITGIGHDRDKTIPDIVAHTSVKTPTAVAAFILDYQLAHLSRLQDLQQRIPLAARTMMQESAHQIDLLCHRLPTNASLMMQREQHKVEQTYSQLLLMAQTIHKQEHHRMDLLELRLKASDPELLLKRGYSLTLNSKGQIITNLGQLEVGEQIITRLQGGEILSEVLDIKEEVEKL